MAFVTPLRYPGGKGRLGPWLADLLRANRISGGTYVEPYAGGAGAAIHLLSTGIVDRIVINDADFAVYAFWKAVLDETDAFITRVERCKVSIGRWEHHREVLRNPQKHELFEVGFSAFFLNRTNRSGILSAGVIGGREQKGDYTLDARFNRKDLASRIKNIGGYRNSIDLYNLDAMDLAEGISAELPKKSLIYFDPPYYNKGAQLYRNFYEHRDHAAIAGRVKKIQTPWLVTYDNCEEISALYTDADSLTFSLKYSTHLSRPDATELMFYGNLALSVPPYLKR